MKSRERGESEKFLPAFSLDQPSSIVLLHVTATRDIVSYIYPIMPGLGILLRCEFCVNAFIRSSKIILQCIIQSKLFIVRITPSGTERERELEQ